MNPALLNKIPDEVREHVKMLLSVAPNVRPDADQMTKVCNNMYSHKSHSILFALVLEHVSYVQHFLGVDLFRSHFLMTWVLSLFSTLTPFSKGTTYRSLSSIKASPKSFPNCLRYVFVYFAKGNVVVYIGWKGFPMPSNENAVLQSEVVASSTFCREWWCIESCRHWPQSLSTRTWFPSCCPMFCWLQRSAPRRSTFVSSCLTSHLFSSSKSLFRYEGIKYLQETLDTVLFK